MGHDDADTANGADGARGPAAAESTRVILGSATLDGPDDAVEVAVPERIGRYRVLGELGKGGMGVVYEAHDPVLDRDVAIKLVRAGRLRSEKGRQRLMREAQTIAQMSHPNIVAVYEVGSHEDQLFIAMELVGGKNLRKWLTAAPRSHAEILAVLEQAGEGLAAAHKVGIVHRDFKPDNVMITPLGVPGENRVRVLDFGLARVGEPGSSDAGDYPPPSVSLGDERLTQTGFAMGTPAYMAPEQFVDATVDPQSDQFAFCVVAIESLGGQRPFTGTTLDELARQTHRAEIDPAALRRVRAGLAGVLRRGLAADPSRRWPDLAALLAAIRGRRRRRRTAIALGALAIIGGAVAVVGARGPACPSEVELRAGLWDDEARARLQASFAAIGTRTAESTWEHVRAELDRRVDAWVGASISSCRARTDETTSCLARDRTALEGAIAALAGTDRASVHNAMRVLDGLAAPDTCDDDTTSPALVDARARLSSAQALAALGDDAQARAEIDDVAAIEDDDPSAAALVAELERLRGTLTARDGDELGAVAAFERSYFAALRSARDPLAVRAAAELAAAGAVGYRERWQWAQHARAALARTDEHEAAAAYDRAMCVLQRDSGALDEARDHCARALAASEGAAVVDERIAALRALADVHTVADRLTEARDLYAEALRLGESSWDADHPGIADALDDLAHAELRLERPMQARELAERALAMRDPDDPTLARSLHVMAAIDRWDGRYREAYDASSRALALRRAALGEHHREVALSWYQLALVEEDLGRTADALRSMSTCAAIEQALHPLDIARIPTLRELARMAYTFGAGPSAGLEHLERAWSIVQDAGVPLDHPLVKDLDHGYGETLLALGRGAEGVPYLERFVDDPRPSPILPHVQFVLARALWARGAPHDRTRAVELVERAKVGMGRPSRALDIDQLEAMRTWLAMPARRDRWHEGMNWRAGPE